MLQRRPVTTAEEEEEEDKSPTEKIFSVQFSGLSILLPPSMCLRCHGCHRKEDNSDIQVKAGQKAAELATGRPPFYPVGVLRLFINQNQ